MFIAKMLPEAKTCVMHTIWWFKYFVDYVFAHFACHLHNVGLLYKRGMLNSFSLVFFAHPLINRLSCFSVSEYLHVIGCLPKLVRVYTPVDELVHNACVCDDASPFHYGRLHVV